MKLKIGIFLMCASLLSHPAFAGEKEGNGSGFLLYRCVSQVSSQITYRLDIAYWPSRGSLVIGWGIQASPHQCVHLSETFSVSGPTAKDSFQLQGESKRLGSVVMQATQVPGDEAFHGQIQLGSQVSELLCLPKGSSKKINGFCSR